MSIWGPYIEGKTYQVNKAGQENKFPLSIVKELGKGGFGIVYLVNVGKKQYALKFLGINCDIDDETILSEFLKEYNINSGGKELKDLRLEVYRKITIGHPQKALFRGEIKNLQDNQQEYVMPIVDVLECDKVLCYLMPCYRTTLRDKIDSFKDQALEQENLLLRFSIVIWKIARVLQRIHDRGLIHRDIKPENIFLESSWEQKNIEDDWEPVVADFGIATDTSFTGYCNVAGDPRYMAPEQLLGHKNYKSDIYALGKVLEELLSSAPNSNAELENIILKMTNEDFRGRYNSQQVAVALMNFIWPRLALLLEKIVGNKEWEKGLKWLDFCWDLLEEREKLDGYLHQIWQNLLKTEDIEFHYRHNIKLRESASKHRDTWKCCQHFFNAKLPQAVKIYGIQGKGRHRYLVTELMDDAIFPITTDAELIDFACKTKDIVAKLIGSGISIDRLGRSHIASVDDEIKLVPWRAQLQFTSEESINKIEIAKKFAAFLFYFWTGKEVGSNWTLSENFYREKASHAIVTRDYLDALTNVIVKGVENNVSIVAVVKGLMLSYRQEHVSVLQKQYESARKPILSCKQVLIEHKNEDLDPYSFEDFYKACVQLLTAQYDIALSSGALTHADAEKNLSQINNRLSSSLHVKMDDILAGELSLPEEASVTLRMLDKYHYPVTLSLWDDDWQETFTSSPKEIDFDELMNITGENIFFASIEKHDLEYHYLLRQKNLDGYSLIKDCEGQLASENAIKIITMLIEKREQLNAFVEKLSLPTMNELYWNDKYDTVYFDWLEDSSQKTSTPYSDLLASSVIPDLEAFLVQIPLAWEQNNREKTFIDPKVLDFLLEENPKVKTLAKEFAYHMEDWYDFELAVQSKWSPQIIEIMHWRHMCSVLGDIELLMFYHDSFVKNIDEDIKILREQELADTMEHIHSLKKIVKTLKQKLLV